MPLIHLPVRIEAILFTLSVDTSPVTIGVTEILSTTADAHAVKRVY